MGSFPSMPQRKLISPIAGYLEPHTHFYAPINGTPEETFSKFKQFVENLFPNPDIITDDYYDYRLRISNSKIKIHIFMFESPKKDTVIFEVQKRYAEDSYKFYEYYYQIQSYCNPLALHEKKLLLPLKVPTDLDEL